jgi:Calx-beta domain-containing protein/putative Ig domain-containing protein
MRHMLLRSCAGLLIIAIQVLIPQPARATSITVKSVDADNEGFNDQDSPDAASTTGGNSGATIGAQRLIAAQFAADIWADLLSSKVPILIDAKFVPPNPNPPDPSIPADSLNRLNCDAVRPVIATGDSTSFIGNFVNAADKSPPIKNTWYPQALANSIAGVDLDSSRSDIRVYFNSSVGTADCLPDNDWYYGLDGNPPAGRFDFVTIALREIGHGLGFKTLVDLKTGAVLGGSNDVFSLNLKDISTGKLFSKGNLVSQMTDAERVVASTNTGNLRWIGAKVAAAYGGAAPMYAPPDINPDFSVSNWNASLQSGSVTIAAGSSEALITVTPVDDALVEGSETVILTLSPDSAYTVGAPSSATVTIADNDTPAPPTVTIEANQPNASEAGPTAGQFTVTRTGSTAAPLTVNYAIGGTATNGLDYSPLLGSVTIPAGSSTKTIDVVPIDDTLAEGNETVILTLRTDAAYNVGTPGDVTVTIADNDSPPTVTIEANIPEASETGPTPGQFTVTRTGSTASPLIVNFTIGGTAINGVDYPPLFGAVTIPAGSSTKTIDVVPIDDTTVESTETVILTLSASLAYAVGTPGNAMVIITDSDSTPLPAVSITANQPNASEAGPTPGQFTVTRTGSTASPLIANYTISGTAINGTDYASLPTSVTIPAGASTKTIDVIPIEDTLAEGSETVILTLSADAAYTVISPNSAIVTIVNALPIVSISANVPNASETGPTAGQFTVTRTGSTTASLTVNYAITGTATNGTDYVSLPTSVTIPASSASATITVTPVNDALVEGNEFVVLTLSANAAYTLGSPVVATVTIADNDSPPATATVSIAANFPDASETGPTPGQFIVTRTGATTLPLTVNYTIGGTATNGTDYTIEPHELLEPFYIAANHDVGLALQALEDIGWTLDPRPNGTVNVEATDATADEVGLTTATFRIHRSVPTDQPLAVNYLISGSATNGSDYDPITTPSSVVIPANESSVTITVTPRNDTLNKELDETVIIQLQPDANTVTPAYVIGFPTSATITIKDDAVFLVNVNPPDGEVNIPYDYEIPVAGGIPPYTATKTKSTLPAGLNLVPGTPPRITGTPTTLAKTGTFTLTVTDQFGASASNSVTLKILKAVTISTTTLKAATIGKPYSALLKATGGKPDYTWSNVDPLPTGFTFESTRGELSGTPAGPKGTYNIGFKVTDAFGAISPVKTLALTIK